MDGNRPAAAVIDVPDIAALHGSAEKVLIICGELHAAVQEILRGGTVDGDRDYGIQIKARPCLPVLAGKSAATGKRASCKKQGSGRQNHG